MLDGPLDNDLSDVRLWLLVLRVVVVDSRDEDVLFLASTDCACNGVEVILVLDDAAAE